MWLFTVYVDDPVAGAGLNALCSVAEDPANDINTVSSARIMVIIVGLVDVYPISVPKVRLAVEEETGMR